MSSADGVARGFSARLALNRAILDNAYWQLPVENVGHESYVPVGRGVKSSSFCGRWVGLSVCKDVEAHKGVFVRGVDCTDKVVLRHKHLWCHKSSCPVCFIRGWSVRQGGRIESRLVEAHKRDFGKVEHIAVSVGLEDVDLPESVLRERSRLALLVRGVVGGCMIFHGFRIARGRRVLVWSPHYHVLGFIRGGFDVCRECVHERGDCASCTGFKGREVREYAKDGYLVKVMAERETVFGSAWYQLNHATVRYGVRRFHVVTWFGVCSYRKFKSPVVVSRDVCPACSGEMSSCFNAGGRVLVKDLGAVGYVPWFVDVEFSVDGSPNYPERVRCGG